MKGHVSFDSIYMKCQEQGNQQGQKAKQGSPEAEWEGKVGSDSVIGMEFLE